MSYQDDLKRALSLLQGRRYTYRAENDSDYKKRRRKIDLQGQSDADRIRAGAVGRTSNFDNSYAAAARQFLALQKRQEGEQLREGYEKRARDAYDREGAALQKRVDSLRDKISALQSKPPSGGGHRHTSSGSSSGRGGSKGGGSSPKPSSGHMPEGPKEPAWDFKNRDFVQAMSDGRTAYSNAYRKAIKQRRSVDYASEQGLRAQGEAIFERCGHNTARALAVAKAAGLNSRYIRRAEDFWYSSEVRR